MTLGELRDVINERLEERPSEADCAIDIGFDAWLPWGDWLPVRCIPIDVSLGRATSSVVLITFSDRDEQHIAPKRDGAA